MKSSLYILFFLALQQTSYSTSCLYLAPSLPQEPQDPDLLLCGRPLPILTQKKCDCRATTESVQVDFGSQGPPPKSQARSEHPASGARETCQKSKDFIIAQCPAFGELCLPLVSPWILLLGTGHTIQIYQEERRYVGAAAASCFKFSLEWRGTSVQYTSIVLRGNAVVVLHAQLLEHDTNLTSSSLQPLFVARMEKYYAMCCIALQGSKSLQSVRFC
jgi:hypothetical protein